MRRALPRSGGGVDLQRRMVEAAGDLALVGPDCYGVLNHGDVVSLWPDIHGGHPVPRGDAPRRALGDSRAEPAALAGLNGCGGDPCGRKPMTCVA